jgi:hypothetical protein
MDLQRAEQVVRGVSEPNVPEICTATAASGRSIEKFATLLTTNTRCSASRAERTTSPPAAAQTWGERLMAEIPTPT